MLAYEADERPSFIELKEILETSQLELNQDNEDFIDALFKEKILQKIHNT